MKTKMKMLALWLLTCGLACILFGSADVKAGPVPLSFIYDDSRVEIFIFADVFLMGQYMGDIAFPRGSMEVVAYADASLVYDGLFAWSNIEASGELYYHSDDYVALGSDIAISGSGFSPDAPQTGTFAACSESYEELSGSLQVGTSSSFPEGSCLALKVFADVHEWGWVGTGSNYCSFSSDDPSNPVDVTHYEGEVTIPVLAGQTLELHFLSYYDAGGEWGGSGYQDWSEQTHRGVDIDIYLVPEPATIALLGFGGLALVRRRRKA